MDFDKCSETVNDKIIKFEEKRSALRLKNPERKKVKKTRVDGCLIKGENKKCDWLASYENNAILIELKGQDIEYAVTQLEVTLRKIKDHYREQKILCVIVSTKVPKMSSDVATIKRNFFKKNKAELKIKNIAMEINI